MKQRTEKQVRATERNFAIGNVRAFRSHLRRIYSHKLVMSYPELEEALDKLEQDLLSVKP